MGVTAPALPALVTGLEYAAEAIMDLSDADKAAGAYLVTVATPRTPRGRTGRLAGSVESGVAAGGAFVTAGSAAAPYAHLVHFGTKHMRARPWLTDATRAAESKLLAIYTEAAADVCNQI